MHFQPHRTFHGPCTPPVRSNYSTKIALFNTIARGYACVNDPLRAIIVFSHVLCPSLVPDDYTFSSLLNTVQRLRLWKKGNNCIVLLWNMASGIMYMLFQRLLICILLVVILMFLEGFLIRLKSLVLLHIMQSLLVWLGIVNLMRHWLCLEKCRREVLSRLTLPCLSCFCPALCMDNWIWGGGYMSMWRSMSLIDMWR